MSDISIQKGVNTSQHYNTGSVIKKKPNFKRTVKWIASIKSILPRVNILHGKDSQLNVENFTNLVEKLSINHGELEAIKRLKSLRLSLQQFILEQPITLEPFRKVDRDLFPKAIKWLKPSNRENLLETRYAMSVLRICELFKLKPDRDTTNITAESTASREIIKDITKFIRKCKWLKTIKPINEGYLPMSNKAGPNGPATLSCLADLTALREQAPNLLSQVRDQLKSTITWLNLDVHDNLEGSWYHSITHFLSDRFGKTRVIAIVDFFSNASLSNIHKTFMIALKNLPNDLTYYQDDLGNRVLSMGEKLFSSDMTAFTDRFPRELEKIVVEVVMGADEAERWNSIIADREFYTGPNTKPVKYKVGNPMGVLSSWAVSTATHHVVKMYCAYKLGIQKYKYLILGDDTLDSNENVYNYYVNVIRQLGVVINTSKSTISFIGCFEFAKRLFYRRKEVTGLPVYLLVNIERYPEQFSELIRICRLRGYEDRHLSPVVLNLLKTLPKNTSKVIRDQLSLPEAILGQAPLLEVCPGSYAEALTQLSEEHQNAYLKLARDKVFWREAQKISIKPKKTKVKEVQFGVKPNHPIVFALSNKLDEYLGTDPEGLDEEQFKEWVNGDYSTDEYTIYNAWIKGDYRYLSNLPSIDTYKYYSKAHKVTKCKYLVHKEMLQLVNTDNANQFLYPIRRLKDYDLFDMGLQALQENFSK